MEKAWQECEGDPAKFAGRLGFNEEQVRKGLLWANLRRSFEISAEFLEGRLDGVEMDGILRERLKRVYRASLNPTVRFFMGSREEYLNRQKALFAFHYQDEKEGRKGLLKYLFDEQMNPVLNEDPDEFARRVLRQIPEFEAMGTLVERQRKVGIVRQILLRKFKPKEIACRIKGTGVNWEPIYLYQDWLNGGVFSSLMAALEFNWQKILARVRED